MAFDGIVPYMLSTLPDILIGIVVVLVLSASMSTLASLVLTSSSTLTLDFLKDNVIKNMSEKKQVKTMQVLVVFFIVLSLVIALDPPTFIAQLMGISWGALAGAFLAPFMYGLYWKGVIHFYQQGELSFPDSSILPYSSNDRFFDMVTFSS